jgi:hypothetical protein
MDVIAARTLNLLYITLDIAWLLVIFGVMFSARRYLALLAGLAGGVIYFAVDYGIFYLALGTRTISGADPVWFLLWLSMSYGFTNIAWIWLLLNRDGKAAEWSLLIIVGWLAVALTSQSYGTGFATVSLQRGTASYHGAMAVILAVGYLILILRNLGATAGQQVNLLWLAAIGIGVQFSWEFVLLISGIRPAGITPLVINSLIETNLGVPYLYLIHRAIKRRWSEDLKRAQVSEKIPAAPTTG